MCRALTRPAAPDIFLLRDTTIVFIFETIIVASIRVYISLVPYLSALSHTFASFTSEVLNIIESRRSIGCRAAAARVAADEQTEAVRALLYRLLDPQDACKFTLQVDGSSGDGELLSDTQVLLLHLSN